MAGQFDITLAPERSLVRLTMRGFYEPNEVRLLAASFAAAVTKLGCPPNQHSTICDIREMAIQSQVAVGSFSQMLATDRLRSKKLAFVTARSLARQQAGRLTDRKNVAFFDDFAAAEGWLAIAPADVERQEGAREYQAA